MSTIPARTSTLALSAADAVTTLLDSPEFSALPAETRVSIVRVLMARAMTEYIRRRWDGTVRWAYDRPMTGSLKVSWSGVWATRKS